MKPILTGSESGDLKMGLAKVKGLILKVRLKKITPEIWFYEILRLILIALALFYLARNAKSIF